ncbi:HAD-IB family hydrolase [Planctomonas sp. JC2975]|uniref:HAD-IB family hydrolase n=1 Tax=Planctomonas sp. JC2975 TaxID=2729626 RepID=UPI001476544D|nr:HAD-IB family hydrolase [Planctomonas sp. JC2975]
MSVPRGVAFFDVDETLVSVRTLESFLMFYLKRVPTMISLERLRELRDQVLELDRTEFNRVYFGIWAGQPEEQVLEAGRAWYAEVSAVPGFFRDNVLRLLRDHRSAGDHIVLVSGSFDGPLRALGDALGIDRLYCTELEVTDGRYTGRISQAMIGDDKRHAVEDYLRPLGDGVRSWGYGDHPSDLPLLERVTDPVVVGSDPAMLAVAADRHWTVLSIDVPLAPRG